MSHAAAIDAPDLSDRSIIGTGLSGVARLALLVGFVCLGIALFLGWNSEDPGRVAKVWLQNWLFGLAISLGAFFFVFLQHLTHAGWSVAVRRPAEALMSNLLWLWIGFIPFVVLHLQGRLSIVWPWFDMAKMRATDAAEATLVEAKLGYLNPQFFFIRAGIYFIVWISLAIFFWRNSVNQDSDGSVSRSSRMERMAAPAALLFGLTLTFAAVDWIMGLSPAWFSTIFGVYFFAGCCAAGFSALALLCLRLQAAGYLKGVITAEHYQDIGKLIFAFGIVFWAYIAFSQYMLIWYANLPEENTWYMARQMGQWGWVSLALLIGHFCLPFLFLISRWTKRYRASLTVGALWMLAFAWIDIYWLVHPEIPHGLATKKSYNELAAEYAGTSAHFGDPLNWLMLAGVLGLMIGFTLMRLREHPLVCRRDPRLDESLHFHNI